MNSLSLKIVDKGYLSAVESCAKEKSAEIIFNSGSDHALAIFVNLFKTTNNIDILAHSFESELPNCDDYIYYLEGFLVRSGKLRVLLEREPGSRDTKLFKLLDKYNVPIQVLNVDLQYNFAVADNRAVRYEYEKDSQSAFCFFNKKKEASQCNDIFNSLWPSQTPS